MTIFLRQSTASQEVPLGYFVDSTDGNAEETGLTIANTDIKIWKTGATTLANKNSGGATHISNGVYYAVLDATDTDTLGPLVIFVHVTGALSVRLECVVLDEPVYDLLITAGTPATNLLDFFDGTGYAGGTTKLDVNVSTIAAGAVTAAAIATGAIDADAIADNAIDAGAIAADAITAAKVAADVSAEIADAVWDEASTGHTDAGKAGEQLWTDVDAILVDTSTTLDDLVDDLETRLGVPSNLGSGATIAANLVDIEGQTDDIGAAGAGLTALGDARLANLDATVSSRLATAGYTAPPSAASVADAVWDEASTGHTDAGKAGTQLWTDVDAILVDTAEIGAAGAGLTAVPWNAAWDAEVQSECDDAIGAALADSVPADGSLPSLKQAIYMITQFLYERSVSGTTVTVRKVDGSTSLLTLTLNDATTPTSITRAT